MNQTNQPIKYFLYARKSSEAEDRQAASIDAQKDELMKIAKDQGLHILDILEESQSAKKPGRKVFNSMLERIYKGEANGILCWKLDRLARNPVDGGQISWMLQQSAVSQIVTFGRTYYPTDNVLMMQVELGMANQFIRDLSVNVKRGLQKKVRDGWMPSGAPIGYLNTPNKQKGYKTLEKDPERFPLVRRLFDLALTGNYSIIDGSANKLGGTGAGNGNFTGQVYTIDRTAPQVTTSHIQSSNATTNLAKVGDTVTVTFTANEAVRTPALSIAGHSVAVATTSGNSFTGSYVMQSTDSTGNVGVNLSLTDLAGNVMATPATVTTDSSTVTFDKTAPTITSITSTQANGSYPASTVIPVSVAFSEVVTVTGTPTLVLNDGGTATYQSGSGTNTLVYSYTVSSGENTSDLTVSSAAGSVADVTGNVANMTLPVGANLGNNSDIVIDTTAPTVALSTSVSTPTNASPFTVTVTFSEPVSGFDLSDVTVGGVDGTTLGNLQTSDNTTFTFEVTPGAEGHVLLTVHAAAASDAASNLNNAQSNTLDITYDTTVPALEITSGPSDPINTDEDVASFAFTTDGTVISCSIDGTATTSSCASPFSVGGSSGALTEGTHVFYVESKDDAGNTALATRSFTVDLTAPTIDAMSDISVTATSPSGAAITYTVPTGHDNIDDAVVVTCDVATSTTLAIGDHVVTCSTHDKAGNTPKSRIFHIYVNDLDGGQFTGIDATQPSATADGTYANGWHWTLKFKLPFGETKFKMKWSDFSSGSDTVTADNIRFCSEQSDMDCSDDSHYMTITASSTMSSAIILSDDADNTADGRQVEIRVEVKVPPTTVPGSYSASYQATSDTVAPPIES
jgi:DNA invertase Pin-like site-specific DNA recombinase